MKETPNYFLLPHVRVRALVHFEVEPEPEVPKVELPSLLSQTEFNLSVLDRHDELGAHFEVAAVFGSLRRSFEKGGEAWSILGDKLEQAIKVASDIARGRKAACPQCKSTKLAELPDDNRGYGVICEDCGAVHLASDCRRSQ